MRLVLIDLSDGCDGSCIMLVVTRPGSLSTAQQRDPGNAGPKQPQRRMDQLTLAAAVRRRKPKRSSPPGMQPAPEGSSKTTSPRIRIYNQRTFLPLQPLRFEIRHRLFACRFNTRDCELMAGGAADPDRGRPTRALRLLKYATDDRPPSSTNMIVLIAEAEIAFC